MENAVAASRSSNGNRDNEISNDESDSHTSGSGDHKRSLSGSILSKLPFLRSSFEEISKPPSPSRQDKYDSADTERPSDNHGGAMSNALRSVKTRKRKGSLRKTALLGTGKLHLRSNSQKAKAATEETALLSPDSPSEELTPRLFSYTNPSQASSSENGWHGVSHDRFSLPTSPDEMEPHPGHSSSITKTVHPHSQHPYASTTDDDESVTFSRATSNSSSASSNYFTHQNPSANSSIQRRRSNNKQKASHTSPLSRPPVQPEDEWDYTETEWWGWVVLIVTWIVFVVGMGSCLGVWSWAWDVGETPYAPPELEDDPTLPIVGYYPALIILTAVMAWVWVVIAWVGMKYFRHAKVVVDDGG
jgi:hypothetical protein